VSSPTLGLTTVVGLSVGDYLTVEGETLVPQLPIEIHAFLAQAAAVKVLEAMGDSQGMRNAETKLQQVQKDVLTLISPRTDGSVKKVVNINTPWMTTRKGFY
jgi:hypothetical protein